MVEKRAHVRVHPATGSQVSNVMIDKVIGRVVDISENGFLLSSRDVVKPGIILQLSVMLRELAPKAIEMGAECIWSDHQDSGLTFAGFQIIDISEADKKLLATVVQQLTAD
ncbi:MAG: PilZ domain-containing protein [Proteobacteria bacterium]|nr:MAG: PilZ domain-containing protein [Pseudomonadota bacterium]